MRGGKISKDERGFLKISRLRRAKILKKKTRSDAFQFSECCMRHSANSTTFPPPDYRGRQHKSIKSSTVRVLCTFQRVQSTRIFLET